MKKDMIKKVMDACYLAKRVLEICFQSYLMG